ncbi:hypothetical protein [Marinobacter lutaoensis]|uniref:hypothetical protein n=1 Tax=Marinobacter lutaoensis TaxID=135739 RepID=UPI0011158C95|nr:hypothetical protein [Marinobacter lutaoensis]
MAALSNVLVSAPVAASPVELPAVKVIEPVKRAAGQGCENPAAAMWESLDLNTDLLVRNSIGKALFSASVSEKAEDDDARERDHIGRNSYPLPEFLTD